MFFDDQEPRAQMSVSPLFPFFRRSISRAIGRAPDFSEKTHTKVVMARHTNIWTGQDCPTGNSTRRETKRRRKRWEDNIREWTGFERNEMLQKKEDRGE